MTLSEITNMIRCDGDLMVYVYEDEDSRDAYRQGLCPDGYTLAVKSPFVLRAILREKYAEAEVTAIIPVASDIVDVIINTEVEHE